MKNQHHSLRRAAAVIIGIVFLVSGLLKMMDPTGTGLIVAEYFKFFHLGFLGGASKFLGVVLSLTESLVGIALITGVLRKTAAIITWALLGVFTVITLLLWIFNPAMDCGCFGLAIHLTHAQSFWKNIVLVALSLFAFLPFQNLGVSKKHRMVSAALASASVVFGLVYSLTHLPLMDFTDFAPGAELFASLDNPYQADDGYSATFVYEKDGQQGSFSLDRLPDSSWTFVRVDTLVRPSDIMRKSSPILSFRDSEGVYQDELAVLGKVAVFSVTDPGSADWERLARQWGAAADSGVSPLLLVFASMDDVDSFGIPPHLPVYYSDYRTLIALNRANGGITYINDGEIISKWTPREFSAKRLSKVTGRDPVDACTSFVVQRRIKAQGFGLYLAAILLLI